VNTADLADRREEKVMYSPTEDEVSKARKENYVMNTYQFQSMAGLTFREAEAFLEPYYENGGNPTGKATQFCDHDPEWEPKEKAALSLMQKAEKKIARCGYTIEEIFGEYFSPEKYCLLTL